MSTLIRVTIIPSDSFCSLDGVGFSGVDMTSVKPEVHALQWYGTHGELEIQNPVTGKMVGNQNISSLDNFQAVLVSYWTIRNSAELALAEVDAEQQIIEV